MTDNRSSDIVERLRREAMSLRTGLGRHIGPLDAMWIDEAVAEIVHLRELLSLANSRADSLQAELEKVRAETLEEAALYVEQVNGEIQNRQEHAAAIRALAEGKEDRT